MIITIGQASAYVFSGMYGDVKDLGLVNALLIILQLFFAGLIVLMLVSLLKEKKHIKIFLFMCLYPFNFNSIGRITSKRIRFRIWYFSFHCHQYL